MFGPLSSFRLTSPLASPPPPAFAARGLVAATSTGGFEVDRARQIARANGAPLHVVSLAALRTPPSEHAFAVADALEDTRSSLAVIGAKWCRASGRSFAEQVYDVASAAVLQVRNRVTAPYAHVIIAVDASSPLVAMTSAAQWVAPQAQRVEYLHAYEASFEPRLIAQGFGLVTLRHYRRECAEVAKKRMEALFERAELDPGRLRLEHGAPALVLSSVPERALLVVHRGRAWLRHLVLGSVTRRVLTESRADVLVV